MICAKIFLSVFLFHNVNGFINPYPKLRNYPLKDGEDAGQPLYLTPLIEAGKIDEARKLATVQHEEMHDVPSYAGYLTVNKEYSSNTFFWFFPAQVIKKIQESLNFANFSQTLKFNFKEINKKKRN